MKYKNGLKRIEDAIICKETIDYVEAKERGEEPESEVFKTNETCVVQDRIKKLRQEHNLSLANVAEVLGVSQREYIRFEQPGYSTKYVNLWKLAIFYNCSLDYIFGLTDERVPITNDIYSHVVNGYYLEEVVNGHSEE